jgi:cell division septum initiation protein DivIVA
MSNRKQDFENMKRKKRVYHHRLRRVIDGLAWCHGREIANSADVDEAQEIMRDEYMAIVRW